MTGLNQGTLVLVMGVAGSGKTLIGTMLAESLGWRFADADAFHPAANLQKMSRGIPLTDTDREPWLATMQQKVAQWLIADENVVLACSALKQCYREQLARAGQLKVVYLKGDFDLIYERLGNRHDHFMRPEMLASQFADLEEPQQAIMVDIRLTPQRIISELRRQLGYP